MTTATRRRYVAKFGSPMTDRELEILGLIADGLDNAEIGRRLYLTVDTVKTHIRTIFQRLGAVNRAHAVADRLLTPAQRRYEENQATIPAHDADYEQKFGPDAGKPNGSKR